MFQVRPVRLLGVMAALSVLAAGGVQAQSRWNAPDRGAKVAGLIPGRRIPKLTPETLFSDWTKEQVARWNKERPAVPAAEAYAKYAAAAPTDAELIADFPVHISPFGRLRSGKADPERAKEVLISYCPFCASRTLSLEFDTANPSHATTHCCKTHLYARDWPADYALKPNATAKFLHLDDTWREVPSTLYRDKQGAEWELFIKTLLDHRRWVKQGCDLVKQYAAKFEETADPLFVHKIAVILDQVADTYYGLPLCGGNELCLGKEGKGLSRAEWEAVPRPAVFEVGPLGPWNRRLPLGSRGWLNMFDEQIWAEPFARVRHHPAFKEVSRQKHGDPEALDRKVMTKLLREISLIFQTCFSQKLLHNYQEANYTDMWLLGVLLQDPVLVPFAGPCQELSMYNHSYQDGLNGEGAPNYMSMPGGYYYPFLKDPKGWLEFYPRFLEDNPFYWAASGEMRKLGTVRGLDIEFGDQHEYAFSGGFIAGGAEVREREKTGSRNWAGYGVGILRVGGPGHRQEVSLDYTRATLHNSQDALSMECWVDGVPVMRKGGYAAWWHNARLQWDRPEFQALRKMDYPHEIIEGGRDFNSWSWVWAHSPLCQNTVTIDETATGKGWGDDRGYGEVITFKGGEAAGAPGSGFQVLDVRDHYSWSRVGKEVSDFRRTAIGIEGPDGRPYVLDILRLAGGQRHALYNNAWGERAEDRLPAPRAQAKDLTEVLFGGKLPEDNPHYRNFARVRKVERLGAPGPTWDLTWKTDYADYAPRDPNGKPFQRPLPDGVGQVRLRMVGLTPPAGRTELLRGKGPWIGIMKQALPGGHHADGNVAFQDARDFLVETRTAPLGKPLDSLFVHVLEGYREGEASAIKSVTPLKATSLSGPARQIVALQLKMAGGHTDTVIYQSEAGAVRLPDGTETDARYALLRRAAGEVIEADACRGTTLKSGTFSAAFPGEFTGTIVDVAGDLTGTRAESALLLKPDKPWPAGANLKGRQLLVRVESPLRAPCNEGYRMEKATALPGGLVRVDLQDAAPFVTSWHEVMVLPADKPNVIRTNRPMVDHGNNPWYCGMKLWFPERGKTYTIKQVNEVGGGHGGDTVELVEKVSLAAEGIRVGDWYVIHAVSPGQRVSVANDFCWRREPAGNWRQYALRATGTATVKAPATAAAYSFRAGVGAWRSAPAGRQSFPGAGAGSGWLTLIADKPAWLNLNDTAAPALVRAAVDGKPITFPPAAPDAGIPAPTTVNAGPPRPTTANTADLGWIDPPRTATFEFRDSENPLDGSAGSVLLDGKPLGAALKALPTPDGKGLVLVVDLARALAGEKQTRRHTLDVTVADRSVDRRSTSVVVSFITKVPLDPNALYLSDLKAVQSFAHGGLILDRDYLGEVAQIAGRVYPKCVMICPEPSPDGTHGQVVYALPAGRGTLKADVGIAESARANGSVVFMVQGGASPAGPWETLYTSPTLRGGMEPVSVSVPLGEAKHLRLYTTDAGDGINSDHALWGNVRLE